MFVFDVYGGGGGGRCYVTSHYGDGIDSESDQYVTETRAGERGSCF